jgi:hypothetical protein
MGSKYDKCSGGEDNRGPETALINKILELKRNITTFRTNLTSKVFNIPYYDKNKYTKDGICEGWVIGAIGVNLRAV